MQLRLSYASVYKLTSDKLNGLRGAQMPSESVIEHRQRFLFLSIAFKLQGIK
ncbi:hypothetical protein JCM19053_1796 [Vibrio sp. JCM 19053]|nr:hypothetical protein JCM19053_1796 [Vibrio sp. JCM 19053]